MRLQIPEVWLTLCCSYTRLMRASWEEKMTWIGATYRLTDEKRGPVFFRHDLML